MDPCAKTVGEAFAQQYYDHLQNSPEILHTFYKDNSKIARPGLDGTMRSSSLPDIIEDLNMLSFGGFDSAEVTSVISLDSQAEGILVFVDGYFTFNDRRERNFTQTFFLAPQEKGHFVLNDIFKFLDISQAEPSITPANNAVTEGAAICVKNLPPNATIDSVQNAFKQFGDIRRGGSELRHKEGFSYGFVVFKEAKAARKAIEASPIMIDGSTSYVEKKRADYRSYWESPSSGPETIYRSVEARGTKGPGDNDDESVRVPEPNDDTGNGNNEESRVLTEWSGIHLKYLPPTATCTKIEYIFQQFGAIQRGGIRIIPSRKRFWCGFVEFEEADAAERAIEASPVEIDGQLVGVTKKRLGGFWEWQRKMEEKSKLEAEAAGTEVDHSWTRKQILEEHRKFMEEPEKRQPERKKEDKEENQN